MIASTTEAPPRAIEPDLEAIPQELREQPQWVSWSFEKRDGKWTKVPVVAGGRGGRASTTNPQTWRSFERAAEFHEVAGTSGIGFVFSDNDPYAGIDLDDCRDPETGEIAEWAQTIIDTFDTYSEVSPSGTGVKLFLRGRLSGKGTRKKVNGGKIELYDRGRYFTVTGMHVEGTPETIEERQNALSELYGRLRNGKPRGKGAPSGNGRAVPQPTPGKDWDKVVASLKEIGEPKLRRLLEGDLSMHNDNHSEADAGLCSILGHADFSKGDVDAIMRRSGLYRSKWDSKRGNSTYGWQTIDFAFSGLEGAEDSSGDQKQDNADQAQQVAAKAEEGPIVDSAPDVVSGPGKFSLKMIGSPRRTTGKTIATFIARLAGEFLCEITITSATSNMKAAAQHILILVPDEQRDSLAKEVRQAIAFRMGVAANKARNPEEQVEGETMLQVIQGEATRAFAPKFVNGEGAMWAENQARYVDRRQFISWTPKALLDIVRTTVDAPTDASGRPIPDAALVGQVTRLLGIVWASLTTTLPREVDAPGDVDITSEAARQFRQSIAGLWLRPQTFELAKMNTGEGCVSDVPTRASLVSRALTRAYGQHRTEVRITRRWEAIHPAFQAWWRLDKGERGPILWLGMKLVLAFQVGVPLRNVTSAKSLRSLAERYGVATSDTCPPSRMSGGGRLLVLSREFVAEITAEPIEDTPSALSQLNSRVHGLQFAPCVFDSHLPINASLRCVNIS